MYRVDSGRHQALPQRPNQTKRTQKTARVLDARSTGGYNRKHIHKNVVSNSLPHHAACTRRGRRMESTKKSQTKGNTDQVRTVPGP